MLHSWEMKGSLGSRLLPTPSTFSIRYVNPQKTIFRRLLSSYNSNPGDYFPTFLALGNTSIGLLFTLLYGILRLLAQIAASICNRYFPDLGLAEAAAIFIIPEAEEAANLG